MAIINKLQRGFSGIFYFHVSMDFYKDNVIVHLISTKVRHMRIDVLKL